MSEQPDRRTPHTPPADRVADQVAWHEMKATEKRQRVAVAKADREHAAALYAEHLTALRGPGAAS